MRAVFIIDDVAEDRVGAWRQIEHGTVGGAGIELGDLTDHGSLRYLLLNHVALVIGGQVCRGDILDDHHLVGLASIVGGVEHDFTRAH